MPIYQVLRTIKPIGNNNPELIERKLLPSKFFNRDNARLSALDAECAFYGKFADGKSNVITATFRTVVTGFTNS